MPSSVSGCSATSPSLIGSPHEASLHEITKFFTVGPKNIYGPTDVDQMSHCAQTTLKITRRQIQACTFLLKPLSRSLVAAS